MSSIPRFQIVLDQPESSSHQVNQTVGRILGRVLIGIALLRAVSLILRVLSSGFRHLGTLLERVYDLPLFVPLWLESRWLHQRSAEETRAAVQPTAEDLREVTP